MIRFLLHSTLALFLATSTVFAVADAQPAAPPATQATDAYGDPLPSGAVARIGTNRFRHGSPVMSLTFSPDGQRISSAGMYGDSAVWDARTGRCLAFLGMCPEKTLKWPTVSADGSLVTGREIGKNEVVVQRALDGEILHRFPYEDHGWRLPLAFSRDKRWLATNDRAMNETSVWDLQKGKLAQQITSGDICDQMVFTPDGSILIQVGVFEIRLLNVETGATIRKIQTMKDTTEFRTAGIMGAAVSPNGQILAALCSFDTLDLWDLKTGRLLHNISSPGNNAGPVFSPDGKSIVTTGNSGAIDFWDVATGKKVRTLKPQREERLRVLAYSPDGKILAAGGDDHVIYFWDVASGKENSPVTSHIGGIPSVTMLSDGRTFQVHCKYDNNWRTNLIDESLTTWDLQGKLVRQAKLTSGNAHAYALSSDGRSVAYASRPDVKTDPDTNPPSSIRLCALESGEQLVKVDKLDCGIDELAFSPNGRFLLVRAGSDTLQIWKRKTPGTLEKVADIPQSASGPGLCVSPDSRWLAVEAEKGCCFHDCETGKLIRRYPDRIGSIAALSASGRILVSRVRNDNNRGSDVIVWEQATGRLLCQLECETGDTDKAPIAVSPNGNVVAGCLNRQVIALWDACTGKQIGKLEGHRSYITSLSFSADGRHLVSASRDSTILIWDWKTKLPPPVASAPLSPERLQQLWQDLTADDPKQAYPAIGVLTQSPDQAVALVKANARTGKSIEPRKLNQWIKDLDSESFDERENAMKMLADAGEYAEIPLRKALDGSPSLEVQLRVNKLLDRLVTGPIIPSTLTTMRSLVLLERINTPAAHALIKEFSEVVNDPIRKREAELSLERLKR